MFLYLFTVVYSFVIVQDEYGIDWDSPSGVDNDGIVETESHLMDPQFEELKQQLYLLEPCDDYGISLTCS